MVLFSDGLVGGNLPRARGVLFLGVERMMRKKGSVLSEEEGSLSIMMELFVCVYVGNLVK